MKLPSSSLRATRTSSSSSTDSAADGSAMRMVVAGAAGMERTVQEGDQLLAGALGAEGEGDGGETVNGIQAEEDIVVLENDGQLGVQRRGFLRSAFGGKGLRDRGRGGGACVFRRRQSPPYLELVDEDGNGIQLVVGTRTFCHGDGCGVARLRGSKRSKWAGGVSAMV